MNRDIEQLLRTINDLSAQLNCTQNQTAFVKFTDKEVNQMPQTFRKVFRIQGCTAHVRKRQDGRYNCSYEVRYNRDGYCISASGTTLAIAKQRFIEKIKDSPTPREKATAIPKRFNDFADYWFENFHKRKVKDITYKSNLALYNRHIRQRMDKLRLSDVTPIVVQNTLDFFHSKPKTQDDIYSLINQICTSAVKHGVIKLNPLGMIFHKNHQRINGVALSREEEKILLDYYANTVYEKQFALLLYTGLRPSEYSAYRIDGDFIVTANGKRKSNKEENKRIPITPMLRTYMQEYTPLATADCLTAKFKAVFPSHRLYDLRTTFQTRCTECGVSDVAIGLFMGNSIGKLKDAYTDVSDDYLLAEGQKLNYNYPKITPKKQKP